MIEKAKAPGPQVYFAIAPLMHGASQWSVMSRSFVGNKNVLLAKFEPRAVWELVAQEKVQALFITGDAMGRPLAEALDDAGDLDLSSLFLVTSTAAVFSPTVKDQFFERFPNLIVIDGVGASEVGGNGILLCTKGKTAMLGGGPTFKPGPGSVVLDENLRVVEAGSGVVGKLARTGHIPLEYYKDPKKSAETFVTAPDGKRYSMPGDFARVEADGQVTLLGRGSVSINSGGEKIYPEEVEARDQVAPGVLGRGRDRRARRTLGQPRRRDRAAARRRRDHARRHRRPTAASTSPATRSRASCTLVDTIERSPAGKPDYRWAQRVATEA